MISIPKILSITALGATLIVGPVFAQNAVIVNGKPIPKAQLDKLVQKTGQDAKAITAQLKAGANFAELAKAKSKDPGSAPTGGDLGWVSEKSLVPEFSKAMVQLKKGQITDKPVKTQFGWHIIKMDDMRDVKTPPMEEIKDQLKQMIASDQNWQKAKFAEMMQKLRAKARIQ